MSIQANMNQAISLAGMMARMNPTLAAKAETRARVRDLEDKERKLSGVYQKINVPEERGGLSELELTGEIIPPYDPNESPRMQGLRDAQVRSFRNLSETLEKTELEREEIAQELLKLDPSEERLFNTVMANAGAEGAIKGHQQRLAAHLTHEEEQQKAQTKLKEEQERARNTRRALGISDLETPTYSVRPESEPSGHQISLPLKTSEREPMYPKKKGAK